MDTRTVGELKILIPDLDPRDLDPVEEPPTNDLVEAMVNGADWAGLMLETATVRLSHLARVNLAGATWRTTSVYACRFEHVDLSGARLTGLTIERCEFIGCRLTGLQLADTTFRNVVFDRCRLDYAFLTDTRAAGPSAIVNSNLSHTILTRCRLPRTVITGCGLDDLELVDCDLNSADLRGNDLSTLTGITSLRGSTITTNQLTELVATLPTELALNVEQR